LDAPPPNPHFVKEPKFLGNPLWQKYSARLDQELKILERFKNDDEPYSLMARQVINAFLSTGIGLIS
jgi:hypothetical protein